MSKVCLVIIFNHKYNKNIPLLQKIYGDKFQNVYYIVPFYSETVEGVKKENIIQVYETSYCFQGYIAQAYEKIRRDCYSHYIFIADDQILNPKLNEGNIIREMGLSLNESYIKEIIPYDEIRKGSLVDKSNKLYNIISAFSVNVGVSFISEIPSYNDAVKKCESFGLRVPIKLPLSFFLNSGYISFKHLPLTLVTLGVNKGRKLRYPLFKAYSDMIIINADSMSEFCRLSGVFAAMNIFVETAIPLAMVLACENIKQEKDLNNYKGIEYWNEDIHNFEIKYNYDLKKLFSDFGTDILYYHPVKLSRWKGMR